MYKFSDNVLVYECHAGIPANASGTLHYKRFLWVGEAVLHAVSPTALLQFLLARDAMQQRGRQVKAMEHVLRRGDDRRA